MIRINNSIFYDNVRVPREYRLSGPGHDAQFYHAIASGGQWHSATMSLGVAQAAFDIDRTDWNISYGSGKLFEKLGMHLVNDRIDIELFFVARLAR